MGGHPASSRTSGGRASVPGGCPCGGTGSGSSHCSPAVYDLYRLWLRDQKGLKLHFCNTLPHVLLLSMDCVINLPALTQCQAIRVEWCPQCIHCNLSIL